MQAARSAAAQAKARSKKPRTNDINDYYTIGKVIGKGTFAAVHLCTCKETQKEWAVKVRAWCLVGRNNNVWARLCVVCPLSWLSSRVPAVVVVGRMVEAVFLGCPKAFPEAARNAGCFQRH